MKTHRLLAAATLAVLAATSTHAKASTTVVTETYGPFTPGTVITDNDAVATSFLASISTSAISSLTDVSISFELRGSPEGSGFANDMFASLIKSPLGGPVGVSDPTAILLNQVSGFYDGWNITLSGSGSGDIHDELLGSGILTGTFEPDGRLAPGDTLRPGMLDLFDGLAGNGDWRLNVADLSEFGEMELVSWSLTLTGEPGAVRV